MTLLISCKSPGTEQLTGRALWGYCLIHVDALKPFQIGQLSQPITTSVQPSIWKWWHIHRSMDVLSVSVVG